MAKQLRLIVEGPNKRGEYMAQVLGELVEPVELQIPKRYAVEVRSDPEAACRAALETAAKLEPEATIINRTPLSFEDIGWKTGKQGPT